jgi:RES domain-containing protein
MATLYRLASAGAWDELDLTGAAAKAVGGRWNHVGTPMVYAASTIALAALETIVHLGAVAAPLNRYVIALDIPDAFFRRRQVVSPPPPDAWDAIPPSYKSKDFGSAWVRAAGSLLLDVPSVIVPQERNVLLNPLHPGIERVVARNLGRFLYDDRLRPPRSGAPGK